MTSVTTTIPALREGMVGKCVGSGAIMRKSLAPSSDGQE
jgi:hypothetical protein